MSKQFLELDEKLITIHIIENFEFHPDIDAIAVICVNEWIDYLKQPLNRFSITKVKWIVDDGVTAQESIRNGLYAIKDGCRCDPSKVIVLIHDGVRPLIIEKVISDNIISAKEYGNTLYTFNGSVENIKITNPSNFYVLRAILKAKGNSQIWGYRTNRIISGEIDYLIMENTY